MARPAPLKEWAGAGAKGTLKTCYIHPAEHVRSKYPTTYSSKEFKADHRAPAALAAQEEKAANRKKQAAWVLEPDSFPNLQLHAVIKHFSITTLGHRDDYFNRPQSSNSGAGSAGQHRPWTT